MVFGKHISLTHNVPFFLDTRSLSGHGMAGVTKRNFSLHKLPNLNYEILEETNLSNFDVVNDNFKYQEVQINTSKNLYFNGYWQNQKYFEKNKEEILKSFLPSLSIENGLRSIIPKNNNSISLHVRRTDYLTSNGFHHTQSFQYYKDAVERIGDYDKIYVFSDDLSWCKNNLDFKNMVFVEGNDEVIDLWLMSYCKNNIIANSSFSWWSVWLNKNHDKKIIVPKKWFGDWVKIDTSEIILDKWIVI